MQRWVFVRNRSRGGAPVVRARWCATFLCKLRGLSLRRHLAVDTGLMLVEPRDGKWTTSIHMFGMLFDIGVVWIDAGGTVVDARHARPWRIYLPKAPARFTLEGPPDLLDRAAVGDVLEFSDEPSV
jgi:uncharacterized membrane protein (UPF0127 family)